MFMSAAAAHPLVAQSENEHHLQLNVAEKSEGPLDEALIASNRHMKVEVMHVDIGDKQVVKMNDI